MPAKTNAGGRSKRNVVSIRPNVVDQFLVVLDGTDPLVWRRIQVPQQYSFWDLHVAIQDAMGWNDCHLHEFTLLNPKHGRLERIGIPDEDFPGERPCLESWRVKIEDYFTDSTPPALYLYDFGDDWRHSVTYEGAQPADVAVTYPRCVSGARACPPEDCGGIHGYAGLLEAVADPSHPERSSILEWIGGNYDPDAFDPRSVRFDDPRDRWRKAFPESRD